MVRNWIENRTIIKEVKAKLFQVPQCKGTRICKNVSVCWVQMSQPHPSVPSTPPVFTESDNDSLAFTLLVTWAGYPPYQT